MFFYVPLHFTRILLTVRLAPPNIFDDIRLLLAILLLWDVVFTFLFLADTCLFMWTYPSCVWHALPTITLLSSKCARRSFIFPEHGLTALLAIYPVPTSSQVRDDTSAVRGPILDVFV